MQKNCIAFQAESDKARAPQKHIDIFVLKQNPKYIYTLVTVNEFRDSRYQEHVAVE